MPLIMPFSYHLRCVTEEARCSRVRGRPLCTGLVCLCTSLSLSIGLLWFVPVWILPGMVRARPERLAAGRWWRQTVGESRRRRKPKENRQARVGEGVSYYIRKIRKKISGRGTRAPRTPQAFFTFLTTPDAPARHAKQKTLFRLLLWDIPRTYSLVKLP